MECYKNKSKVYSSLISYGYVYYVYIVLIVPLTVKVYRNILYFLSPSALVNEILVQKMDRTYRIFIIRVLLFYNNAIVVSLRAAIVINVTIN